MANKVTIISKGGAFITDALAKNLRQAEFVTSVIAPDIRQLDEQRADSDIYLIYAGDYVTENTNFFVYLKDVCSEDEKLICVIGYIDEINEIKGIVSANRVALEFTRPFDMKLLISNMQQLCEADAERKKGKHILLIDDDLMYLKTVQSWLSPKYRTTSARSGMQAITYIAGHVPDLILLDYEMPITTGPQVMEMIRSEPASGSIPIIFLTGKSDKESVMRVMALKPQGYMLKSMPKETILETIDNFFKTKKWTNG